MTPLDSLTRSTLDDDMHRRVAFNVSRLYAFLQHRQLEVRISDDLAETARIFSASGQPLAVLADPAYHNPADPKVRETTLTAILLHAGQPVGCTAQRRIFSACPAVDMANLRYWYGDAARAPAGTRCHVPEGWLMDIGVGWTLWSCSFHVAPAHQSRGVQAALIRIAHALAMVRWTWQWLLGRAAGHHAAKYPFDLYGVNSLASGLFLLQNGTLPDERHPQFVMGARVEAFRAQAIHPYYGDPLRSLALPPDLRADDTLAAAGLD